MIEDSLKPAKEEEEDQSSAPGFMAAKKLVEYGPRSSAQVEDGPKEAKPALVSGP